MLIKWPFTLAVCGTVDARTKYIFYLMPQATVISNGFYFMVSNWRQNTIFMFMNIIFTAHGLYIRLYLTVAMDTLASVKF